MHGIKSSYRILAGAVFATVLALLPSCGSKDSRPLVLVDVPVDGVDPGNQIDVKVLVGDRTVAEQKYPRGSAATAHLGIYLPSGTIGDATVVVSIVAGGCAIATGTSSAPVPVKAGETSAAVIVTLVATNACGASSDGGLPAALDGGVDQLGEADVGHGGSDTLSDSAVADAVDAATAGDVAHEVAEPRADAAVPVADAPMDLTVPVEVAATGPEVGPDSSADVPTTMNVLGNCTQYTHSKLGSDGGAQDWGFRRLVFSPDGKYLVSFG